MDRFRTVHVDVFLSQEPPINLQPCPPRNVMVVDLAASALGIGMAILTTENSNTAENAIANILEFNEFRDFCNYLLFWKKGVPRVSHELKKSSLTLILL